MDTVYLDGTEPGIRELGRAAFREYRGRQFRFRIAAEVQPRPTYWDGGTRYQIGRAHV